MEPPQHEKVVEDCDEALKLDSRYVKALNRRATALEALERYEEALRGACCWSQDPHTHTLWKRNDRITIILFFLLRLHRYYDSWEIPK